MPPPPSAASRDEPLIRESVVGAPVAPRPAAGAAVAGSVAPESVAPELGASESVAPGAAAPEPVVREPGRAGSVVREPAAPERVVRERGDACPGALRLHAADDGFLARVRIPAGLLGIRQAELLALAADRFGDGRLDLTSRGNVQLRGLADGCGSALAALLDRAGLLPAPGHERVRNIVATPLSAPGDPLRPAVRPWALELDRLLCANARVTALSGRFLFAFDDGRGDVAALGPDVTVLGRPGQRALVRLGPADDAVEVSGADAPRAALLAAEYFLDAAVAAGTRAWRVRELPTEHALDAGEFAGRLAAAGIPAERVAEVAWPYAPPPLPGFAGAGASAGADADADARRGPLCVLVPLGRLASGQLRALAAAAAARGGAELLITPWRGAVLHPGPADADSVDPVAPVGADRVAAGLARAGLVVTAGSAWQSVTACTGQPGCAKSLADVRADAAAVAEASPGPLPVHWSGCERRCGHPQGDAWVDVTATATGYELSVHGRRMPAVDRGGLAAALTAARTTPDFRSSADSESDAAQK